MKCSKCGKDIANDSLFCEFCGSMIRKKEYKVHIKCLLYVAMLLNCMTYIFHLVVFILGYLRVGFNPYNEDAYSEAMVFFFYVFFVQFCIFIISLVLLIRKRIPVLVFILSLLILIFYFGIQVIMEIGYNDYLWKLRWVFNTRIIFDGNGKGYGFSIAIFLYQLLWDKEGCLIAVHFIYFVHEIHAPQFFQFNLYLFSAFPITCFMWHSLYNASFFVYFWTQNP
jgi:hypothetical protein